MRLAPLLTYLQSQYDRDAFVYKNDSFLYYGPDVPEELVYDIIDSSMQIYSGYYTFHKGDDSPRIYYLGRGKRSGKFKLKIQGFMPYGYDYSEDGEYKTYLNEKCEKLIFKGQHPSKVKRYRESRVKRGHPQPLECDILFHRRFLIDTYDMFKPKEPIQPKTAIIDIETNHPINKDIISYAVNDLETGEIFYESKFDGYDSKELSKNLIEHIKRFDLITGWNLLDFDVPIIEKEGNIRLHNIVTMVDLLEISKKMYAREIRGRWSLDNVGSRLCGIAKSLDEDDIKLDVRDLNEEKLKMYNCVDVIIPEIIDEILGGLEGHLILAWSLQVGIDDVIITAVVNDIALLREYHKNKVVLHSREYSDKKSKEPNYEAADPDAKPGIYDGAIETDIVAAYASAVIAKNISAETKDKDGIHICPDGIRFNDGYSVFIDTIKNLMEERIKIKKKLGGLDKNHKDYKKLKSIDFAYKTQVAAFSHGIFGWENSRMRDYGVADAICSVLRDILNKIKITCELIGKKWVYLHTDSCFINASKEEVDEILAHINKSIRSHCKDYKILPELEYKGFYPLAYIHSKARRVLVPEGIEIDDDENWVSKGCNFLRSETPEPLADIEIGLIKMKLKKESNDKLMIKLKEMISELPNEGSIKLAMIKPLNRPIDKFGKLGKEGTPSEGKIVGIPYHISALKRGINEYGLEIPIGSKFGVLPIKTSETVGVRVIRRKRVDMAFDLSDGLPSNYEIDWEYYLQSNLYGKVNGLFEMMPKELEKKILGDEEICEKLGIKFKGYDDKGVVRPTRKASVHIDGSKLANCIGELKKHANDEGLPIFTNDEWENFKSRFTKAEGRRALSIYITTEKPNFPFRKITYEQMKKKFNKLLNDNLEDKIIRDFTNYKIFEKYDDYTYTFDKHGFAMINVSPSYNSISDYFQQNNRLSCGSHMAKAPTEIWKDRKELEKLSWTFWRRGITGKRGIDDQEYRKTFRLGSYTATQFKPPVAKAIYLITDAEYILDTSCGWGDRLAGFYCTPNSKEYWGCDPNKDTFETYKTQCKEYENLLGHETEIIEHSDWFESIGSKYVRIYNIPAEDMVWERKFDCMFTSPPYFSTERYAEDSNSKFEQSWYRYPKYENWRDRFLFKMIDSVWSSLSEGGMMIINIMDPKVKNKRYKCCDEMIKYVMKRNALFFGQIGMRIMQRPKDIGKVELDKFMAMRYIENMWCFRKGR